MQQLLIEVSHEDQIFFEKECTEKGHSFSDFFELLLNDYRRSQERSSGNVEQVHEAIENVEEALDEAEEEVKPKRRGRPKKYQ